MSDKRPLIPIGTIGTDFGYLRVRGNRQIGHEGTADLAFALRELHAVMYEQGVTDWRVDTTDRVDHNSFWPTPDCMNEPQTEKEPQ